MVLSNQAIESGLLPFYLDHLANVLLPFWKRAVNTRNGGVYTCFNNAGTVLVSRDKYTWSQGRFIWLWSKIAGMSKAGLLSEQPEPYLSEARKTVEFIQKYAILPNGNCAGECKEALPGEGYDISFYADCFVILGFTEYAKVSGDTVVLENALLLYDTVLKRVREGSVRSEPYPIPDGMKAHSVPMILLNVTLELYDAVSTAGHVRTREFAQFCRGFVEEILGVFVQSDGWVAEMVSLHDRNTDTVVCRHLNPGHAIEDMWFLMRAAIQLNCGDWITPATEAIRKAFELGWDPQYGGLFRFVDWEGGPPTGRRTGDPYERLILDTWDTKLWWPHTEALYATLLAYDLTSDEEVRELYEKTHDYVFRTFPNPDASVGEWIQIRDRAGRPVEKLVALPVKDPFHILRSVLLIIELLYGREGSW